MKIPFYKYQGTGNDFILIDNRQGLFDATNYKLVGQLCDRRFGIGADGLMLLQSKTGFDFEMVYYNADGNPGSMCGNGGRCIVAFAHSLGLVKERASFIASDGPHEAEISKTALGLNVKLKMSDVDTIEINPDFIYMNTGSPHYVTFVSDINAVNVVDEGRKVRYNERFKQVGTNVNFVERLADGIFVRTYERGVEDETYSCGTGVTASVLAAVANKTIDSKGLCSVKVLGGNLKIHYNKINNGFTNIWLEGPAVFVFKGDIDA